MSKFEKVKAYFDGDLWDLKRVRDAVLKGWITQEQFDEITNGGDQNVG